MIEENLPSILIVISDTDLASKLSDYSSKNGLKANLCYSGDSAIKTASSNNFDVIILDSSLPDISGIGVCTILRIKKQTKNTPIIMLTNEDGDFYKVKGIENGIDDYLVKPVNSVDFISRVKNLIKRVRPYVGSSSLEYKDLKIDISSFRVTRGLRDIHLGPTEFKILQCLMEYPRKVLSREYIMTHVWGTTQNIEPRTVDVHINRLRTALRNNYEDLPYIRTIRSVGYCLGMPNHLE